MAGPGRPPREREPDVVWNIKLLLYQPEDADLIALYHRTPSGKKATVVKARMRSGAVAEWEADETDEAEMYAALSGLIL